jgi:hypothetical protein
MTTRKGKQSPTDGARGGRKLKLKKETLKDLDAKSEKVKGGRLASTVPTCGVCVSACGARGCG